MIEIRNLTKIFTSKHHEHTRALNDVSFDLPDNGFVFIVGKSGSGKTTLLNMIAGVDSFNSGEIAVNGIKLSKLKGTKLDYYRNEMIGFVFQDYQLIDELTVFENIKLALEFTESKDDKKVYEVLKKVDLSGYEKRYPRELSGGEKQRVAIARALVKNPKIILADEPTGNLDTVNTNQVLKILESISKEKLVLIVSHNIFDAHQFATYLLELQNGEIINSYKRNENINRSIEYKNNILRLPFHKAVDKKDKKILIKELDSNIENVIQDDLDFVPFEFKFTQSSEKCILKKKHISVKNALKHGFSFIKRSLISIFSFSLIVGTLFGVVNTSEAIKNIDTNKDTLENIKNYNRNLVPLIGIKNKYTTDAYKIVKDEDITKIRNGGYEGKIYEGFFASSIYRLMPNTVPFHYLLDSLLIVDEDYFKKGDFNFDLVSETPKYEKFGIYITDFSIDIKNILDKRFTGTYDSFLEYENPFSEYVNGVINTHYKEKFPKIYEIIKSHNSLKNFASLVNKLPNKMLDDFYYECGTLYSHSFSLEKNFFEEHIKAKKLTSNKIDRVLTLNFENNKSQNSISGSKRISFSSYKPTSLSYENYQELTGKELDFTNCGIFKTIEPIKIKIDSKIFEFEDTDDLYTKPFEIEIKNIVNPLYKFYVDIELNSNEYYDEIISMIPRTMIVLDDCSNLKELVKNRSIEDKFVLNNFSYELYFSTKKLSSVFDKLFALIILVLLVSIVISLIFYSINLVKNNIKNIGIFKSLGARSFDILLTLSINLIISLILTIFLYFGLSYGIASIGQLILLNSIRKGCLDCMNINNASLIILNPKFHIINIIGIIIFSSVSFLTLFIKLNRYKPTELIKSTNR